MSTSRCRFSGPKVLAAMLAAMLFGVSAAETMGGDWPQLLGPDRNGVARDERLAERWPADGPQRLWAQPIGSGYAGPAVAGNRVLVFHRIGDDERLEARSTADGSTLWKADFQASYSGGYNPDNGPRCVPLIGNERVFVLGAAGQLHCVDLATGAHRWSRDLADDYQAPDGYFGIGSSPILAGNRLLVNIGGRAGAGIVALAADTGKTLWTATDERASYASPTAATLHGKRHYVFLTRLSALSVDPQNGDVLFRFPFGKRGLTVTGATPLVFDDQVFVTASYNIGAKLVRFDGTRPETVWESDEVLSSQYTTSVYQDGYLYGIHGREDDRVNVAQLRCVEARTGQLRWSVPDFGVAHLLLAGDKLLILKVDGQLVLAEATPEQFRSLAAARVADGITRSLPALAEGRLFVRVNADATRGQLIALRVGQQ